jgi:hypothetical protein
MNRSEEQRDSRRGTGRSWPEEEMGKAEIGWAPVARGGWAESSRRTAGRMDGRATREKKNKRRGI